MYLYNCGTKTIKIMNTALHSKGSLLPIKVHSFLYHSMHHYPKTTTVYFISCRLIYIFRILYKWNHKHKCIFVWFLIRCNYFEIHLCCCKYQWFIPVIAECYSIVWMYHNSLIHSLFDGHFRCTYYKQSCYKNFCTSLYVDMCFHFLG